MRERLAHIDRNEVRNLLQAWELEANWSASFDIEASNASEEGIFSTDHSLLGTYEEFFEDYDMDELGCMINPYFDSRPVSYSHTSDNLDERLFDFN